MALRNFIPSRNHLAQYGDQITVAGWFDILAGGTDDGDIGAVSSGRGWSVVHAAAGTYTITFEGPLYSRLAFTASVEDTNTPSGTDVAVQLGAWSGLTQQLFTVTAGTTADATGGATIRVHFIGVFRTRDAL